METGDALFDRTQRDGVTGPIGFAGASTSTVAVDRVAKMERVVGITRVAAAVGRAGAAFHRQAIEAYCDTNDLVLVEVLNDDGVSSISLDRPALKRAIVLAEAKAINAIVLTSVDQLGTDSRVINVLLTRFRNLGCRVLFADGSHSGSRRQVDVVREVTNFDVQLRKRGGRG